jgi:hypothetical protein
MLHLATDKGLVECHHGHVRPIPESSQNLSCRIWHVSPTTLRTWYQEQLSDTWRLKQWISSMGDSMVMSIVFCPDVVHSRVSAVKVRFWKSWELLKQYNWKSQTYHHEKDQEPTRYSVESNPIRDPADFWSGQVRFLFKNLPKPDHKFWDFRFALCTGHDVSHSIVRWQDELISNLAIREREKSDNEMHIVSALKASRRASLSSLVYVSCNWVDSGHI